MADMPITRVPASEDKQAQMRSVIQGTTQLAKLGQLVTVDDVAILTELLADPSVSGPIYTLPAQINTETVTEFIEHHLEERACGEGLLMMSVNQQGLAYAYYDIQFWPQWSACELGGAIRTDSQSSGKGGSGALESFRWLFEDIGVDLICETAALDNVRTASLLERIGFKCLGEIQSDLPDGGTRPSRYWELNKADWQRMNAGRT